MGIEQEPRADNGRRKQDRRQAADPNYQGIERRLSDDRRVVADRRRQA